MKLYSYLCLLGSTPTCGYCLQAMPQCSLLASPFISPITAPLTNTATYATYSQFVSTRHGTSFREWVNSLRLAYAKQLMTEHPDMPITEVSKRAGYLSLSYFTRTFKESEGVTPGRWTKAN